MDSRETSTFIDEQITFFYIGARVTPNFENFLRVLPLNFETVGGFGRRQPAVFVVVGLRRRFAALAKTHFLKIKGKLNPSEKFQSFESDVNT